MASNLKDMTWSQVQSDPRFTSANPQQKQNIENAWKATQSQMMAQPAPANQSTQPTAAPQQSTGFFNDVGDTIASGLKGAAATASHGIVEGGAGLVQMADTAANKMLGMAPSSLSTYAKRVQDRADEVYQRRLQEAKQSGHETAFQRGGTVGQVAADIGTMIAAPEVAIPAIAGREAGGAYARQAPEDKSISSALAVGGANYLAGKILPGATGEVAEGLINQGINAAKNIGKNAWAGAKGGSLVGATQAVAQNPDADLGDVIGGGVEGGLTGAAFGGTFGAAHEAVGSVSRRTAKAATDVANELPPVEKADIADQASTIGSAQTPQEAADAYKSATGLRSVKGSAALDARGIPLTDARFTYSPDAAAAHGVSPEQVQTSRDASRESATNAMTPWTNTEAPGKMAVAKNQWETGGRRLVGDVQGSMDSGSKTISNFLRDVQEDMQNRAGDITPAERDANTQLLSSVKRFNDSYSKWQSSMNRVDSNESVRSEQLLDDAARAQEDYNALPDYFKQHFDSQFKDIGEGFQKGFAPVDNSATYLDAFSQLKSMHPNFRNAQTNPSQGAVKGVQGTSMVDLGTAAYKAFKARGARNKMVSEQERSAATVRSLASGLANAERRTAASVENARSGMENPVVDDGTQAQMEYSNEPAPETTVTPQPDQAIVRSPRRPEPPAEPEPEVIPEPAPTPTPSPDQAMVQTPRQPAPVEEPAVASQETPPVEEPAPAPQPDRELTRVPRRPSKSDGDRYDELARKLYNDPRGLTEGESKEMSEISQRLFPSEEVNTPSQPDQSLVREPTRPQEQPVQEETTEAPTEPQEAPQPEPDQTLARTPKTPETAAEEAPAPQEEAPAPKPEINTREAGVLEQHQAKRVQQAIENEKKKYSSQRVKDQITPENYNDKAFLQRLKREDVADNTTQIQHAAEQHAIAKNKREQKQHDLNMTELENWAKEQGVDYKFVTQAIEQKGLQKSRVLGVNDIKTRATKLAVEDAKPAKPAAEAAPEKEPVKWQDQRDTFRNDVAKMDKDVRAKAMQYVEQAFKASEKTDRPLTESDVHGLWSKIYNHEAEIQSKAGKTKEADEAKAKAAKAKEDAEAISSAKKAFQDKQAEQAAENEKIKDQLKLGEQTDDIHSQIHKYLKDSGLPKADAENYANQYMDEHFGVLKSSMNDVRYNNVRQKAIDAAKKFGKDYEKMNPAEVEEAIGGSTAETEAAKKAAAEVKEKVKGTTADKNETADMITSEMVDRAQKAYRDGDSVEDVAQAAEFLAKAYDLDATSGYSLRRYPQLLAKAQSNKEAYPNNPEVWLTSNDVSSLRRNDQINAKGLMNDLTNEVLGEQYVPGRMLTEVQAEALRKRLDKGETVPSTILKRRGALAGEESAKPKATIRRKGSKAGRWNKPAK